MSNEHSADRHGPPQPSTPCKACGGRQWWIGLFDDNWQCESCSRPSSTRTDVERLTISLSAEEAWTAFKYVRDLFVAVSALQKAIESEASCGEPESQSGRSIVAEARRTFELISFHAAPVDLLAEEVEHERRFRRSFTGNFYVPTSLLSARTGDLTRPVHDAEEWVISILTAAETFGSHVCDWPDEVLSRPDFLEEFRNTLHSFSQSRLVKPRLVYDATTIEGGATGMWVIESPENDDAKTLTVNRAPRKADPSMGDDACEIAAEDASDDFDPSRNDHCYVESAPDPLSARESDVLVAMHRLSATADAPRSQFDISLDAYAEVVEIKGAIRSLNRKGLVDTGRGVGTWLTPKGITRAMKIAGKGNAKFN